MSSYTTELRYICENLAGLDKSGDYNDIDAIIEAARPKLFSFSYPIFDEAYRKTLETKIIFHFYRREIGSETVGLFKYWLKRKMCEIMPYYNQLYKSELLEFNPFYDVDLTRDHQLKTTGETKTGEQANTVSGTEVNDSNTTSTHSTGSENTTGEKDGDVAHTGNSFSQSKAEGVTSGKQRYSDTPQGTLKNIEDNTYLTNATLNDGTTSNNQSVSGNDSSHDVTGEKTKTEGNRKEDTNTDSTGRTETNNTVNSTKSGNVNVDTLDDYIEHVKGKNSGASYSDLLIRFRETFLNIDMNVIEELNELFMLVW